MTPRQIAEERVARMTPQQVGILGLLAEAIPQANDMKSKEIAFTAGMDAMLSMLEVRPEAAADFRVAMDTIKGGAEDLRRLLKGN